MISYDTGLPVGFGRWTAASGRLGLEGVVGKARGRRCGVVLIGPAIIPEMGVPWLRYWYGHPDHFCTQAPQSETSSVDNSLVFEMVIVMAILILCIAVIMSIQL